MTTWRERAEDAIYELAKSGRTFTSDDLIDMVGVPDKTHKPNARNNQIGMVFREACAKGLITSSGRLTLSKQPHRKGGAIREWKGIA